jgi:rhodanese-related sulfurtransferase
LNFYNKIYIPTKPGAALLIFLFIWLHGLTLSASQHSEDLTIPPEFASVPPKKRNPALAISVESVVQRSRDKQEITLVDVRKASEFEKFRIPGSIHIPLFAVKTKTFIKPKPLVLINEGYSYSQLEQECARLRESGFRAWILNGGLYYWRQKGMPLQGDALAMKGLNRMPPRELFKEKDYENWLMIDVSPSTRSRSRSLIPRLISVPYRKNEKEFIAALNRMIGQHKAHYRLISVLICSEKGEQYYKVEKILKKTAFGNAFFLRGGMEAYEKFLVLQAMIKNAGHNSKKTLRRCTSCP